MNATTQFHLSNFLNEVSVVNDPENVENLDTETKQDKYQKYFTDSAQHALQIFQHGPKAAGTPIEIEILVPVKILTSNESFKFSEFLNESQDMKNIKKLLGLDNPKVNVCNYDEIHETVLENFLQRFKPEQVFDETNPGSTQSQTPAKDVDENAMSSTTEFKSTPASDELKDSPISQAFSPYGLKAKVEDNVAQSAVKLDTFVRLKMKVLVNDEKYSYHFGYISETYVNPVMDIQEEVFLTPVAKVTFLFQAGIISANAVAHIAQYDSDPVLHLYDARPKVEINKFWLPDLTNIESFTELKFQSKKDLGEHLYSLAHLALALVASDSAFFKDRLVFENLPEGFDDSKRRLFVDAYFFQMFAAVDHNKADDPDQDIHFHLLELAKTGKTAADLEFLYKVYSAIDIVALANDANIIACTPVPDEQENVTMVLDEANEDDVDGQILQSTLIGVPDDIGKMVPAINQDFTSSVTKIEK